MFWNFVPGFASIVRVVPRMIKEFGTLKFCPGCQESDKKDERIACSQASPEAGQGSASSVKIV